jgi:hypothetical protein
MSEYAAKAPPAFSRSATEAVRDGGARAGEFGFADHRDGVVAQRRLQRAVGENSRARALQSVQDRVTLQLLKKSQITSKASTTGASRQTVWNLRTNRPPYAEGQVDAVWDAAPKDATGRAICPNTGEHIAWAKGAPRQGVWDMGHKAGHEYRTLWLALALSEITYPQFLAVYQDPANYQVEEPSANRGHGFEADEDDG